MMGERPDTTEDPRDPYLTLARMIRRKRRERPTLVGTSAAQGGSSEEVRRQSWRNPMTAVGDIITGDTGGAPKRLAVGAEGQVLGVVAGQPAWMSTAGIYSDEQAQDAVGTILQDTASVDFTYDDATPAISANVIFAGTGAANTAARSDHQHQNVPTGLTVILDGGGSAITTSQPKPIIRVPYAATVTAWYVNADQSGSIVVDVKRASAGAPTTFASIAGTEKPTLSSQQANSDAALSTWTTSLAAGDWLRFDVESAATVTLVAIALHLERTI